MIASRSTFARMDAAAMLKHTASPFTTVRKGRVSWAKRLPSTSRNSGGSAIAATARRMARKLACRMLISSISAAEASPMPKLSAPARMRSADSSRCPAVRAFESAIPSMRLPGVNMTAAATTGPASGPRPASSTPAKRVMPEATRSHSI